jgi:GNAT superfamily N-acetyltransferase
MMSLAEYYNLHWDTAEGGLGCWGFLQDWWRLYAGEQHWAPPYYPALKEAINPDKNPHLKRLSPRLVCLRGIACEHSQNTLSSDLFANLERGIAIEKMLACGLLLYDARRTDNSAYLALLHCQNTSSALDGIFKYAAEELSASGAKRILGPVGISPWISRGVLANRWNQTPPMYAAYNPPFLPELMEKTMDPRQVQWIYRIPVKSTPETGPSGPARLERLDTSRLANDLLGLLGEACQVGGDFPAPDEVEARFLLRWIGQWPEWSWLAKVDGQPAGFMVLQADMSPVLRHTHGGRTIGQRLALKLRRRSRVHSGRLVFAGVAPAYRRMGIASQLWQQAAKLAHQQGWETVSAGPLAADSPAALFCTRLGGRPEQEYRLYSMEF